jgi:uncharacterized protein
MVIAGGSGFLGRNLAAHFAPHYDVVVLTRGAAVGPHARAVQWDAQTAGPWACELDGAAVLINLTGRSVNCRYNAANKETMMTSRIASTHILGESVANSHAPPPVWINSSTATIYKHTLGPPHGEDGEIGATPSVKDAFAVEIAQRWEAAFFKAACPGVRQVVQRTAIVMANEPGTAFDVLGCLARKGLGGAQAGGRQFVSWLHIDDYCRITEWLVANEDAHGVYNVCAPNPLTNAGMMKTLRSMVGLKIGLPAPRWLLEIGAFFMRTETELILKSRNVVPTRLLTQGFRFGFSEFGPAMKDLANRPTVVT